MKTQACLFATLITVCSVPAVAAEPASQIAWHGTWEGGLAAAKKTGKPIMFLSAAPHCRGVPGTW